MFEFQERMIEEKRELDVRAEKLFAFTCGEGYLTVTAEERDRLRRQLCHMQDYSKCLGERIAAF